MSVLPEFKSVQSSNIDAIGFNITDSESQLVDLFVRFKSGHVFRYADVPRETAIALENAKSVGGYFARFVRNQFKGENVEQPKVEPPPPRIAPCRKCGYTKQLNDLFLCESCV